MNANKETFKQRLLALDKYYHIHHPLNIALNSGEASQTQIQGWVINRFYYQINIPIKDAAIIANCPLREIRQKWLKRIIFHDGEKGGIEAWLHLGEACGIRQEDMTSLKFILPGVRFAVDSYVNFAKTSPWQEGICSSLSELFAPKIHHERIENWPKYYPWIESEGFQYFKNRIIEVNYEVEFALNFVLENFITEEQQNRAIEIVKFKLNVLWAISDALYIADTQSIGTRETHV